jgi:hypothetical protein
MKKKIVIFLALFMILGFLPLNTTVEATWWDTNWNEFVYIYIKKENIQTELTDYPVLVVINSTLGARCNNGNSIRFLAMDNSTEYPYEIERWNSSGDSFVYVKIPTVYAHKDTPFIMYFNNSGATDNETPPAVWTNNYTAVWHFNESSGTIIDSLGNYDLTNNGATYVHNSHIGGGYSFDGINDYMNVSGFTPNDVGAITFLTQRGCSSCGRRRFCGAVDYFEAVVRGDNLLTNHLFVAGAGILTGTALTDTTNFHHLVFSWNYSSNFNEIYDDGILDGSGYLADDDPGGNLEFELAHSNWYSGEYYNGEYAEFRIHSIDRNISWYRAEYENLINATNFTYFGTPYTHATVPPYQYNPDPYSGEVGVTIPPTLCITVGDSFNRTLTVYWFDAQTWTQFAVNVSVNTTTGDVRLCQPNTNFTTLNVTYCWSVNVTHGTAWSNATYCFNTTTGNIPDVTDPYPADNSLSVCLPVSVGINVTDIDQHNFSVWFYTNASGTWQEMGQSYINVTDGYYYVYATEFTNYNTTYWWRVKAQDEVGLVNWSVYNSPFKFTTSAFPCGACDKIVCCDDYSLFLFMGFLGIFGLFSFILFRGKKE